MDRFGRVKSQIWKTSSSLRDQQDYDHDLAGNRIQRDTYHYYLSHQNQVLEEQKQVGAGSPTLQNDYIWHPHYVDALAIRYDVSGVSPVAYYALHDANYNITAMVDGNGAVVERYQYTPYGQVICTDPSFANPMATSTIGQRNLYTGRELDLETGLYYYRARYYHQTLGRFITRDPIQYLAGTLNLYCYADDAPTNLLDPTGLVDWRPYDPDAHHPFRPFPDVHHGGDYGGTPTRPLGTGLAISIFGQNDNPLYTDYSTDPDFDDWE